MKRVMLLALAAALLLPCMIGSGIGERLFGNAVFENEDLSRKDALSAAIGRTEGDSLRFFSHQTLSSEDRYIVRFAEAMSEKELMSALDGRKYTLLSDSAERVFAVCLPDAQAFEDAWGEFVLYCCADRLLTAAAVPGDPRADMLDAYETFELNGAWEAVTPRAEVIVAVLDTGVDRAHEDLAGANILDGYDAVAQSAGVFEDTDGHGTAVTGLIAAAADNGIGTAGVAHGVTVMPIRVSNDANRIYSSDLISGIRFAADAGADILNLSFGGYTYSAAEYDAVSYALDKGCILIAAAGNDGQTAQAEMPIYPAAYDGVISVGSCTTGGTRSLFSQNNNTVDVLAPGEDLLLLAIGETGYRTDSGTSYSAAIVSGVAALALSALDADVRFEGAELLSLLANGRRSSKGIGYGTVSALSAVQNANAPQVVGVESGKTYTEKVTVHFNRGNATLDGEAFFDGETVYQNGTHQLTVTDGTYRKNLFFRLSYTPASYEKQETDGEVRFSYSGGTATVDGMPYVSGTPISTAGWHLFRLTDSLGETQTEQFYCKGVFPVVDGIEDGGVYGHPVRIRIAGDGTAELDGEPFGSAGIVMQDGAHELTVTDGLRSETYRFTLQTGVQTFENDLSRSGVIASDEHGWYAIYSEMLTGIRIYDAETGEYHGFIGTETVEGYTFANDMLLIFGEWQLTVLDPALMLTGDPRVASYSIRCDGFAYADEVLYCLADGELLSMSVEDGSTAFVRETDATEIYSDGTELWLYAERANRFDRLKDGVWESFSLRFDARLLRKRVEGGWMFCGGYALRIPEHGGELLTVFAFDGYAVGCYGGRLFSTGGVYRLSDGELLGGYRTAVSCVLQTERGSYVCGMLGELWLYPHGADLQYGYAPYEGSAHTEAVSGGDYTELLYLYGNAFPSAMNAYGDRFGAVFSAQRSLLLYHLGVKLTERHLPFAPDGLVLDASQTCVWNSRSGLLWLDGTLLEIGRPIKNAFFVRGTLYLLSEESLYRLEDGAFVDAGIRAADAVGAGDVLAWYYGGMLFAQYGEEIRSVRSAEGKLMTDGTYVLCGKKVYRASDLLLMTQSADDVLALGSGALLTKSGLYDPENGEALSYFDASGCLGAVLGGKAGAVFWGKNMLTIARSKYSVAAEPFVDGITDGGLADGSAVIYFDCDYAFLDGEPLANGSTVSESGTHVLTLVLPCAVVREYTFTVVPRLGGIAFSNTLYRLPAGESDVLHVRYLPEGTSSIPVVYTVEGDCILLNEDGSFAAMQEGEAVVTAQTEDGAYTATCRIIVSASLLRFDSDAGYRVDRESGMLFGVSEGTSAYSLLSHVLSDGEVTVSDATVRTGTAVTLRSADGMELDRLTVVLTGDLDRDGFVTLGDLLVLEETLQAGDTFAGELAFAADLNGSGTVTNRDATVLRDRLLYASEDDRLLPALGTHGAPEMFVLSSVCVGDTMEVTLYLRDDAQTNGLSGRMFFDPNVFRFEEFESYGMAVDVHVEQYYAAYLISGENIKTGSPLMTLRFTVLSQAKNSELRLCDGVAVDAHGVYTLPETACRLSPAERVYGDLALDVKGMASSFSPDVTEYDVYVPLGTVALDYAVQYPELCDVTVRNTIFDAGDTLTATFTFHIANKHSITYTVRAYRTDMPPIYVDTTLSSLVIAQAELPFEPSVTAYTLAVPFDMERLHLEWTVSSDFATVECSDTALIAGEHNTVTLTVKAPNGDQTVYTLTVYRESSVTEESSREEGSGSGETSASVAESGTESEPTPRRQNGWVWLVPLFLLLAGSGVIVGMVRHDKKKTKGN